MRKSATLALVIVSFVVGGLMVRGWYGRVNNATGIMQRDTIFVIDTFRTPIPPPQFVEIVKYERIPVEELALQFDTMGQYSPPYIELPIEEKVYQTDDYRATVRGFRPELTEMEIYRRTNYVTNTVKKNPRWSITAGAGFGYSPAGFQPYIGISVGFVLWSW